MAAPRFAPVSPVQRVRSYGSPPHVPGRWAPERPGEIRERHAGGARLGYQGPDQGYALSLAERVRPKLHPGPGLTADDAIQGCCAIALRRASLFGRAPVMHDLTLAFTIWGFFDEQLPPELVARRRELFAGVGDVGHRYAEARALADLVPEATLRLTPQEAAAEMPAGWRELTGA